MFCFYGFFPDFSGIESGQVSDQGQGVFGVMGLALEWGSDMGKRAVFMRGHGQMRSARLMLQKCSGHGKRRAVRCLNFLPDQRDSD